MAILELSDASFDAVVNGSKKPVLVDFRADWCGPCRQIGPSLEELSVEMSDSIRITAVDVDSNPEVPAMLGVRGIPALFIFKNGEIVAETTGAKPKAALKRWIEKSI